MLSLVETFHSQSTNSQRSFDSSSSSLLALLRMAKNNTFGFEAVSITNPGLRLFVLLGNYSMYSGDF